MRKPMPHQELASHWVDVLQPLGAVQTGKFFGGVALKLQGRQFAMLMSGRLYFVVGDNTRKKYEKFAAEPFAYDTKNGRVQVKRYFEVPVEIQEDVEALMEWAREAVMASQTSNSYGSDS
jgi:DNA transformation protein and related proteins